VTRGGVTSLPSDSRGRRWSAVAGLCFFVPGLLGRRIHARALAVTLIWESIKVLHVSPSRVEGLPACPPPAGEALVGRYLLAGQPLLVGMAKAPGGPRGRREIVRLFSADDQQDAVACPRLHLWALVSSCSMACLWPPRAFRLCQLCIVVKGRICHVFGYVVLGILQSGSSLSCSGYIGILDTMALGNGPDQVAVAPAVFPMLHSFIRWHVKCHCRWLGVCIFTWGGWGWCTLTHVLMILTLPSVLQPVAPLLTAERLFASR